MRRRKRLKLAMATGAALWIAGAMFAVAQSCAPLLTAAELEQLVASVHRKSDSEAARHLAESALCEQVDFSSTLRMAATLPGENSRKALMAITDVSSFESAGSTETPAKLLPEPANREEILSRIRDYAKRFGARLPNFSAARSTSHFAIASAAQLKHQKEEYQFRTLSHQKIKDQDLGAYATGGGHLRWMGVLSEIATILAGREVTEATSDSKRQDGLFIGMTTNGEFGPMLGMVVKDASPGNILWERWEGSTAVFRYAVPQEKSHFAVAPMGDLDVLAMFSRYPPYHGEIAVDPADGAIQRLTLIADLDASSPEVEARISVEYAPTVLGGKTYQCPVHAVAISKARPAAAQNGSQVSAEDLPIYLNDITFTQYHLLRGDVRILPADPTPQ